MTQSTTSLKLDDDIKLRVRNLAKSQHRTAHWIMREAIQQYIEREEKQQQFRQSALSAWENYQTSGLYVTAQDADEWLSKLEQGEDPQVPQCHV